MMDDLNNIFIEFEYKGVMVIELSKLLINLMQVMDIRCNLFGVFSVGYRYEINLVG